MSKLSRLSSLLAAAVGLAGASAVGDAFSRLPTVKPTKRKPAKRKPSTVDQQRIHAADAKRAARAARNLKNSR